MTATLTSTDIDNDRCPKCGAPIAGDIVRITRAEYEALRVAAKALRRTFFDVRNYERINNLAPNPGRRYCWDSMEGAVDVLAALRAAGIDLSEPIKAGGATMTDKKLPEAHHVSRRYALDVAEWCERELVAARATGNLETRPFAQNAELIIKALREFGGAT